MYGDTKPGMEVVEGRQGRPHHCISPDMAGSSADWPRRLPRLRTTHYVRTYMYEYYGPTVASQTATAIPNRRPRWSTHRRRSDARETNINLQLGRTDGRTAGLNPACHAMGLTKNLQPQYLFGGPGGASRLLPELMGTKSGPQLPSMHLHLLQSGPRPPEAWHVAQAHHYSYPGIDLRCTAFKLECSSQHPRPKPELCIKKGLGAYRPI